MCLRGMDGSEDPRFQKLNTSVLVPSFRYPAELNFSSNKAFIDIRLCPGIATPLVVWFSLPRIAIRPTTTKCDVIDKTGST